MTNGKERKKIVLWLAVLALLAAAGFGIAAAVRHNQRPVWDGGYSVHISEVMTDNTTCPNEEGVLCDWVEIENTSSKDFSLAGYYLSDEAGKGQYCFPAGTVVPGVSRRMVFAGRGGRLRPLRSAKGGRGDGLSDERKPHGA